MHTRSQQTKTQLVAVGGWGQDSDSIFIISFLSFHSNMSSPWPHTPKKDKWVYRHPAMAKFHLPQPTEQPRPSRHIAASVNIILDGTSSSPTEALTLLVTHRKAPPTHLDDARARLVRPARPPQLV